MDLYLNDNRILCKYGENCYQKNPQHHKKFKHPPKDKRESGSPPAKKLKAETEDALEPPEENLKNDFKNEKEPESDETKDRISPPSFGSTPSTSSCGYEREETTSACNQPRDNNNTSRLSTVKCNEPVTEDNNSEDENDIIPESPSSIKENIKQKFLVDMPKDFYDFWDLCKNLNKDNPEEAFRDCGLKLVGAFDILSCKLKNVKCRRLSKFLCHWRFYYDPPEFQTVIIGDKDEYHIGYFRDDPSEEPVFLASMSSLKPGIIQTLKEDLFSSIFYYIKSVYKGSTPQKDNLLKAVKDFADEKGYKLDQVSDRFQKRRKKIVSKAFHGAGVVVPVNKETDVGYREIPETTASLKKILKNVVEAETEEKKMKSLDVLQELMTNAQWATDEGDFGMGLELGLDLFTYGGDVFHSFIRHLLTVAYDLLNREAFSKIIQAHLRNRKKGLDVSSFDEKNM